ncbi:MAG TPA: SirB2 family protein [Zoogloea sp.]|nr:SirB2 family protein [Zoogloea sp.]
MYLALKHFHLTCVVLSIAGFALRGWWSITGSPRLRARLTRTLPHLVDSCLLASAISMAWIAGFVPFVDDWLTAKIGGLLLYIGLGAVALKATRPRVQRATAWAAAMAVYSYIVAVAMTKNPLGWLALL